MESSYLIQLSGTDLQSLIAETLHKELAQIKQSETQFSQDDEILRTADLMKLFGVSKPTIIRWRIEGLLPFKKIGRRVYFRKSEILEILKSGKVRRLK